ncbi:hypothetical protein Clacol_000494 [Clathrus columnatus]|uniref:Uncharacterized protein n=1 Tax=Clathrus columnatus TaxID=1419009 RepID=A0AAV4ZYN7_9AGAM|nr:hypothetical protein Clacol_000494 [Clathrus columnatus]
MVQYWEPGTRYSFGDVVESDWTPSVTPGKFEVANKASTTQGFVALWGRIPNESHEHHEQRHEEAPRYEEKPPQAIQQPQSANPPQAGNPPQPQEKEKHWYDLDEKQKKGLEIGGGVAAGLGLLAAGVGAYRHQKLNAYSQQRWIEEARARTADFHQHGPRGPTTWVLVQGKEIPPSAIVAGRLQGQPLYIARAFHEGGVQLGQASRSFPKGGRIGWAHKLDLYEVLIGDSRAIAWIDVRGKFKPEDLNVRPVEGGHEGNGTPLYIALVNYDGIDIPGKASRDLDGAFIAYDGTEKRGKEYKVLTYA